MNKMTKKRFYLGMLVIALAFGMTVVGCDLLFPEEEPEKEGEINWNGHRYALYVENTYGKSWTDARDYCKSKGGHLATITSAEEQEAVYDLVKKGAKNMYWIGGYLDGTDFVWVTEEQWKYTNWYSGEPNDQGGNESYVQMYRERNGQWNDGQNKGDPSAGAEYWSLKNTGFICEWD